MYNHNSRIGTVFHNFPIPEKGSLLAGYSALIGAHTLIKEVAPLLPLYHRHEV